MSNPIANAKIAELVQGQTLLKPQHTLKPGEFDALLSDRLKVSGHAKTRLESRNIQLGRAEWERVLGGIEKAAAKGAKDSLVMLDDIALVVSVKNRTVITAVNKAQLKENVFTNIDSAVIV